MIKSPWACIRRSWKGCVCVCVCHGCTIKHVCEQMVVKLCVMWVLLDFHLSNTKPTRLLSFSHSLPLCFSLAPSLSHLGLFLDQPTVVNSVIALYADSIYNVITSSVASSPSAPPWHMLFLQPHSFTLSHLHTFTHFSTLSINFRCSSIWFEPERSCFSEGMTDLLGFLMLLGRSVRTACPQSHLKAFFIFFRLCILLLCSSLALCPSQWRSSGDWIQPPVSLWSCLVDGGQAVL